MELLITMSPLDMTPQGTSCIFPTLLIVGEEECAGELWESPSRLPLLGQRHTNPSYNRSSTFLRNSADKVSTPGSAEALQEAKLPLTQVGFARGRRLRQELTF